MGVYTHKCKIDGIETSYFIESVDSCKLYEHKAESVAHACCDTKVQKADDGCCSTDESFVHLDLDLSSSVSQVYYVLSPAILALQPVYVLNETPIVESVKSVSFAHPPPKNQGRNYQSLFQVYTI